MEALTPTGAPEAEELAAALALEGMEGLGPARARRLVDLFGSPARTLRALEADRREARGRIETADRSEDRPLFGESLLDRLARLRPVSGARLREIRERGIRMLAYGCPGYPERLEHLPDPPTALFLQGPASVPERGAVTIVGTRAATAYGRRMAGDLAAGLAERGHAVVSGLALGIDGAAHRGALAADGLTVGVPGSGFDHQYPAGHRRLYREIRERGLLLTEFPPEVRPARSTFPRRNRVLAALAEVVVVVQAPRRSGALNTVTHALELGRDVLAVPGPVGPEASDGVHQMLREGAGIVTGVDDVRAALGFPVETEASPRAEPAPREPGLPTAIHEVLSVGAAGTEALAAAAGLSGPEALALLSRLELEGRIRALPGGRYVLARR